MRMPTAIFAAVSALALTAPLHAMTVQVAAGEGAQTRLQEALIAAQPGDVVHWAWGALRSATGCRSMLTG